MLNKDQNPDPQRRTQQTMIRITSAGDTIKIYILKNNEKTKTIRSKFSASRRRQGFKLLSPPHVTT